MQAIGRASADLVSFTNLAAQDMRETRFLVWWGAIACKAICLWWGRASLEAKVC